MILNNQFIALGMMSGTSLDGLDLALCRFQFYNGKWSCQILKADSVAYDSTMKNRLATLPEVSALEYFCRQRDFSEWVANQVNLFLADVDEKPQLIASHGHTVFHNPKESLTVQMGSGAIIAAQTGIPTVADFRTTDVALGGQGAPLVPIGDKLLFSEYDACLNLGGISNISFDVKETRVAFDISLCNIPLNFLAEHLHFPFDKDGEIARSGKLNVQLLQELNNLPYFRLEYPKSLGREWFEDEFKPILENCRLAIPDVMRTVTEHIAQQIANVVPASVSSMLVTGGGARNLFLMERIRALTPANVVIPDSKIVDYKEALVFAFLGVLRMKGDENVLKEVTGAQKCSCSGAVYYL